MMQLPKKAHLRVDEAAAYFRVADSTVRRWINNGQLPAYKIGSRTRIKREDIESLPIKVK